MYEQKCVLLEGVERRVKGFIGLVGLRDYEEGAIRPHMEYIWSIYQDHAFAIDMILDDVEYAPSVIDHLEQPQGVGHRLWRLVDE